MPTRNTSFVEGLVDEILAALPLGTRIDMILNWATKFAEQGYTADPAIAEIIGTITSLDFSQSRMMNEKFANLVHMPFSPSLRHISLYKAQIGPSPIYVDTLAHPIFQHLETLNLHDTKVTNIDSLLHSPHPFPNLRTLDLSSNHDLSIPPKIATMASKFPKLKFLGIFSSKLDPATIEAFSAVYPTTATTEPLLLGRANEGQNNGITTATAASTPFQFEKFTFLSSCNNILSFSRSPHLSQVKELNLGFNSFSKDMVTELFDPETTVLENLTHLQLQLNCQSDNSPFVAVAQSPLLSNLTTLELSCSPTMLDRSKEEINEQLMKQFINSPFLWNPQLKHLSLKFMPFEFVFDDLIPILDAANIKLETLDLSSTTSSLDALATASCLSQLKLLRIGSLRPSTIYQSTMKSFVQSPILSNLVTLHVTTQFSTSQWVSILSSPAMSNDFIELHLSNYPYPVKNVIQTLCTQRKDPNDPTSPLKFEKLRKLDLSRTTVTDHDVKLIVENLTHLTHLYLGQNDPTDGLITDKTITTLIGPGDDSSYPYPPLPHLTHLGLSYSSISVDGFVALSKSQLLDQLEWLNVSYNQALYHMNRDPPLAPGLQSLFTTPLVSNLRHLCLNALLNSDLDDLKAKDESLLKHYGNCLVANFRF